MASHRTTSLMRAFRRFRIFGALTLIGLAATIMVQGGWQAAAAAFAMFNGAGFAVTFAALGAASERPLSPHPSWALAADSPRPRVAAEPSSRRAASAPDTSQPATPGRRPLAPRPAPTA